MERTGTFYLNNRGDRWVVIEKGKRIKVFIRVAEGIIERTHIMFESFGNFASVKFKYKGKIYSTLNYALNSADAENLST